ncbi:hypothetical protein AC579_3380 [Pseudocercospora musae]|uniref:Adenosine 5'-monophosphoramidase HNT1 n=2 Tax=Pseudocercospora TaxID=131324 RepID=A0A139IL49_9PEZI|nr:hypothetical protein AC579_3380 [Pseudocercospora musae]
MSPVCAIVVSMHSVESADDGDCMDCGRGESVAVEVGLGSASLRSPARRAPSSNQPLAPPACEGTASERIQAVYTIFTNNSSQKHTMAANCIFCKIIKGDIPSMKLFESEKTLAFLDIGPLSQGHALVIPKYHGAKLLDIPDEDLSEVLPVAKKIAKAVGSENYNILQNNGRLAHQEVDHVHFHVIPKPNEQEGLQIGWPTQKGDMEKLKKLLEDIKSKM